jgi:urea transporter
MSLGAVFLESVVSGVITEQEIALVTGQQSRFALHEAALAIRLGRLLDEGQINRGCRLA